MTASPITGPAAVDVLVDGAANLGALSYLVAEGHTVVAGDAVTVGFNTSERFGMVLGRAADPARATRPILTVHGRRSSPEDIDVAAQVASAHFAKLSTIANRLRPTRHKGASPLPAEPATFTSTHTPVGDESRKLLLVAPLVDPVDVAVSEAARIATRGQVLILCPSGAAVNDVLSRIPTGAVRLDANSSPGEWASFREGTRPVGVGTRTAALYSAQNLAGIVVVDESHIGHEERNQPYTHARDVASIRTAHTGADLVLVGSVPTPKALGCGVKAHVVGGRDQWPGMLLVDRSSLPYEQRDLPRRLLATIERTLGAGRPVTAIAQTRPAAWHCIRCFEQDPQPVTERRPPTRCSRCSGNRFRIVGFDAARLKATVPAGVDIVTLDKVRRRPEQLVVIFDVDSAFHSTSLGSANRVAKLRYQAAAAAGPGGRVIAVTDRIGDPTLRAFFEDRDLTAAARRIWETARECDAPPFRHEVRISIATKAAPNVRSWPGEVHGPRSTIDGWEVMIRCAAPELPKVGALVANLRRKRMKIKVRVA